jgi:hypothetical protein
MLGIGLGVNAIQQGLVSDSSGLPPGAIAYADFKNGTYYYGGNALSDFLTENTDWGSFNPALIVPNIGLYKISNSNQPVIASALASALLVSGFTAVATIYLSGVFDFGVVNLPDYDTEVYFSLNSDGMTTRVFVKDTENVAGSIPAVSMHRVAMTYNNGRAAMSIDGNSVIVQDAAESLTLNAIVINGAYVVSDLTFYPAKSDGDTQTLATLNLAALPVNSVAPAISGTAQVGQTLTCSAGTWTNADSTHFQWIQNAVGVAQDADSNYVAQVSDEGSNVTCDVFAENATGFAHYGVASDTIVPA